MSKKIVFIAIDNGIDGREKDEILYASFDEDELKALHKKDKSAAWRRLDEKIIDVESAQRQALSKLNGVDRLVLGLPNWVDETYPPNKINR